MLLGKRPRPPMRRTTSMTEFAADLGPLESNQPSDQERAQQQQRERQRVVAAAEGVATGADLVVSRYVQAVATPRGGSRRSPGDFTAVEPASFLRACSLCKRRLGPGRDTFMYRGDTAFCSLECRQQQMNLDERKEKCSMSSMKKDAPPATTTASETSNSSESMAVA